MKKIIGIILSISLMISCIPMALASDSSALNSLNNHWSKEYITYLYEKEVIFPTGDSFTPDTKISRAEFMRYINRAFNFNDKASISFSDVEVGKWYYDEVAKAVHQGYMEGTGNGKMDPNGFLTRQEAVVIISRLHNTEPTNTSNLKFSDTSKIADWSAPYVSNAVDKGYISGRTDGTFDPLGNITRGEIAKILYLFAGTILDAGINTSSQIRTQQNNVTITEANTTLKNATVKGDLFISQGVGTTKITLENVKVDGSIIIAGGNVDMTGVSATDVIVKSPQNEKIKVTLNTGCEILNTYVYTKAELAQSQKTGFENVIEKMQTEGNTLSLSGNFREVVLTSGVKITLTNAEVLKLVVDRQAKNAEIILDNANLDELSVNATAKIYGTGNVYEAFVNAASVVINADVFSYYVVAGYSAMINGTEVFGDRLNAINPSVVNIDKNGTIIDQTISTNFDTSDILRITYGSKILTKDTDYTLKSNSVIIKKEFIKTLTENQNKITFVMNSSDDVYLYINYVDGTKNSISHESVDYDKYADNLDIEVVIFPSSGQSLVDIYYGGYYKLTSSDYFVQEDRVYLSSNYLNSIPNGKAVFTFKMTGKNDPTVVVNITDSAPPNSITPQKVTFDTNIASSNYSDVMVTLNQNDGVLKGVFNGTKQLVENIDYLVTGDKITIRREYFVGLGSTSTVNLTFNMSKGTSPILNVTMTSTYQTKATILDTSGLPVSGATVTVNDQTVQTDKNGVAYLNLPYGNHTIEISKTGYRKSTEAFYISQTIKEKTFTLAKS